MSSVLIVDDDDDIRDLLQMFLEEAGHHVVGSANGLQAQRLLAGGLRPEVIILDLMMPVMSGWELRKWMLRDPSIASIPTIVITGDAKLEGSQDSLQAKAYVAKPFELQQILDLLPA
jgi:CheY-like chemotaxis protein